MAEKKGWKEPVFVLVKYICFGQVKFMIPSEAVLDGTLIISGSLKAS